MLCVYTCKYFSASFALVEVCRVAGAVGAAAHLASSTASAAVIRKKRNSFGDFFRFYISPERGPLETEFRNTQEAQRKDNSTCPQPPRIDVSFSSEHHRELWVCDAPARMEMPLNVPGTCDFNGYTLTLQQAETSYNLSPRSHLPNIDELPPVGVEADVQVQSIKAAKSKWTTEEV